MKRELAWMALTTLVLTAIAPHGKAAAAATGAGNGASAVAEVWVLPQADRVPAKHVRVELDMKNSYPACEPVPFVCTIATEASYENARVTLRILDETGKVASEGELILDIYRGENACTLRWDASETAPGYYTAEVSVDYTREEEPAVARRRLRRISGPQLARSLARAEQRLSELAACLETAEQPLPYLELRHHVAADFIARAREDLKAGLWRALGHKLEYLKTTANAIDAGIVFAGLAPERCQKIPRPGLDTLQIREGALFAEGRPCFLFGSALQAPDVRALEHLREYGLRFAVLETSPADTLAGPDSTAPFEEKLEPFFGRLEELGMTATVQLKPTEVGGWALDTWPDMTRTGFVDLSHPSARHILKRHLAALLPFLNTQPALNSVSLAHEPKFKFDGEAIRQLFIEHVQEIHPDRQDLNAAWRAHLAGYEEITIWDEEAPEHSYQNRRAYQYDWQTFHRNLATHYLDWLKSEVRAALPGVPLLATLADSAFTENSTRFGVDQEELEQMLDISGCTASVQPHDRHYAFAYPQQPVLFTLIKSLAPDKPLFTLNNHVLLDPTLSPEHRRGYVQTILWEAVIAGVNAMALAPGTELFDCPQSTEAYATTALDINRLAPVVHAFQTAPARVGILYSDSSRIFDEGSPHLMSAKYAYEGCSFGGYQLRFVTEDACIGGCMEQFDVLVIPETPAVRDETFAALADYAEQGGTIIRVGTPIPYNERGMSRYDVLRNTGNTILVRGMNLPTEYLHAMDAAITSGALPWVPRAINTSGYPVEGIRTQFVNYEGEPYLYIVNLRKTPAHCELLGSLQSGRDLIQGRDVSFPRIMQPLDPMLIKLDRTAHETMLSAVTGKKK